MPTINGYEYSYSAVEIVIDGERYTGVAAISYKHSKPKGKAMGASNKPLALTTDQYQGCEGSVTLLKSEANRMRKNLGAGYLDKIWSALVTYAAEGQEETTDELEDCAFSDEEFSGEPGPDGLTTVFPFVGLMLKPDGVSPIAELVV